MDVLLDGGDWRWARLILAAGVKAGAERRDLTIALSRVTVPGDTQLQAGFTGVERFNETKELIAVNGRSGGTGSISKPEPRLRGGEPDRL